MTFHRKIHNINLTLQIDFLKKVISEFDQPRIIDYCCGEGRHLIPLHEEGYDLTGLDVNEEYLQSIRERTGNKVNVICADARHYKGNEDFDLVLNMETSIVYNTDEENFRILDSMYSCLKPGGMMVLHLANREFVVNRFQPLVWFEDGSDGLVLRLQRLNPRTGTLLIEEKRLRQGHVVKECRLNMRLYTLTEIIQALERTGFTVEQVHGDFKGSPYTFDSMDMVLVCRKPPLEGGEPK
ncbi:class I SAM-dependent methyltransferase [Staphylospora marina]|uniref:class I SAM-dependent methyltransferase n=1 Tax=Staphylospora marina TaxID=2490858 RepID=UPI001F14A876|nr:class I SAM-dependent methyltransferase [Staphylospora marina]